MRVSAGAGTDKVTGKEADWFGPTVMFDGRVIAPKITVTPAVAVPTSRPVAVIVAGPAVTPVTGTLTLVAVAGITTLSGTVATLLLEETRLTVTLLGAGAERISVRVPGDPPAATVTDGGEKLAAVETWTG
jgi:hypothetical protein